MGTLNIPIDFQSIWSANRRDARLNSCTVFIQGLQSDPDNKEIYDGIINGLAERLRMRPVQVKRFEADRLAEELDRMLCFDSDVLSWLRVLALSTFNEVARPKLVASFRKAVWGLVAKGDRPEEISDDEWPPEPNQDELKNIIKKHVQRFDAFSCWNYFASLRYFHHVDHSDRPDWPNLYSLVDSMKPTQATAEPADVSEGEPKISEVPLLTDENSVQFPGLTHLDDILIQAIVATAQGTEGALSPVELERVVEEFASLNPARQISYSHVGYLRALFDKKPDYARKEFNPSRKAWYFFGYLKGLLRKRSDQDILAVIRDSQANRILQECFLDQHKDLLNLVLRIALRTKDLDTVQFVLKRFRQGIAAPEEFYQLLLQEFSSLRSDGEDEFIATVMDSAILENPPVDLILLHGAVMLATGKFDQADSIFRHLAKKSSIEAWEEYAPEISTSLGLITIGCQKVDRIRIPQTDKEQDYLLAALDRAAPLFEKAVSNNVSQSDATPYFCLGLLGLLRDKSEDKLRTRTLLSKAANICSWRSHTFAPKFTALVQTCLALTELEMLEGADIPLAIGKLTESIKVLQEDLSPLLVARLIRAAETINAPELFNCLDDAISSFLPTSIISGLIQNQALLTNCPKTRVAAGRIEIAKDLKHPPIERFRKLEELFGISFSGSSGTQECLDVFDQMESLAEESGLERELFEFLDNSKRVGGVLSDREILEVKIRVLTARGDKTEACALLTELFHKTLSQDSEYVSPDSIIDVIRELGDPSRITPELANVLKRTADKKGGIEEGQLTAQVRATPIRIVFIGGNERQRGLADNLPAEIKKDWPGLSVEFHLTGFGSNWGKDLGKFKKMISECDAVVLSWLVRTNFGGHIRKMVSQENRILVKSTGRNKPWIRRDIERAAMRFLTKKVALGSKRRAA